MLSIDDQIEKACAISINQPLDKNQDLARNNDLTSLGEKLKITNVEIVTKIINDCLKTYPNFETFHKICDSKIHAFENSPNLVMKSDLLELLHNLCDLKIQTLENNMVKKADLSDLECHQRKCHQSQVSNLGSNSTLAIPDLDEIKKRVSDLASKSDHMYNELLQYNGYIIV